MTRYRWDGTTPCGCNVLYRDDADPIRPGEIVESDAVIHNPLFTLVDGKGKAIGPALISPDLAFEFGLAPPPAPPAILAGPPPTDPQEII